MTCTFNRITTNPIPLVLETLFPCKMKKLSVQTVTIHSPFFVFPEISVQLKEFFFTAQRKCFALSGKLDWKADKADDKRVMNAMKVSYRRKQWIDLPENASFLSCKPVLVRAFAPVCMGVNIARVYLNIYKYIQFLFRTTFLVRLCSIVRF